MIATIRPQQPWGFRPTALNIGTSRRSLNRCITSVLASSESDGDGIAGSIENPSNSLRLLAFLPQFVDTRTYSGPVPFLLLCATFVVGGTLWCLDVALCAATATVTIRRNPQALVWLELLSGYVYISLGLNLLRARLQPA